MAIKETNPMGDTQGTAQNPVDPAQAAAQEAPRAAPGATGSRSGHLSLTDMITRFNTMGALSAPAKDYLEKLKESLDKHYRDLAIELLRLPEPAGSYAFICENKAILLIFAEMISAPSQPPMAPKSRGIDLAIAALQRLRPDATVLNAPLVQPSDYEKVEAMGMYIGNNLLMSASGARQQPIDITNFTENTQYAIDLNADTTREFVDRYYPHKALPRMDLGMVIYHRRPRNDQFAREGIVDQDVAVAAVGAYVEMIRWNDDQLGHQKFLPLVRITNITSVIPAAGLMLIAMQLAAEHFCTNGRWIDQFRNFSKKGTNLGNLIIDPETNKPYQIDSAERLDQFQRQFCLPPMLAIDVVEGQARLPGLTAFQDMTSGPQQLAAYISRFFRTPRPFTPEPTSVYTKTEFIGYYGAAAPGVDTREVTYLDALARSVPPQEAQQLLWWPADPAHRARLVSDILGGMQSMHLCTTAVLSPNFLVNFGQVLAQTGVKMISTVPPSMAMPMMDLAAAAQAMRAMPHITTNPSYQSSWPHAGGGYGGVMF